MFSLEKLEGLEDRIVKALQDLNNLKLKNSELSNKNSTLTNELDSIKLNLSKKEEEIRILKEEIKSILTELNKSHEKKNLIENRIDNVYNQLDSYSSDKNVPVKDNNESRILNDKNSKKDDDNKIKKSADETVSFEVEEEENIAEEIDVEVEFNDDDFGEIVIID